MGWTQEAQAQVEIARMRPTAIFPRTLGLRRCGSRREVISAPYPRC
jgi:hypothetical protein